jgi:RNA-directed DNA polymerase
VDGVTRDVVAERIGVERFLASLRTALESGSYRSFPARVIYVPKANGGKRRISVPTIRDRVVQTALKLTLEPGFEREFLECSYAYRPGRGPRMAAAAMSRALAAMPMGTQVITTDVEACFDQISHGLLLARVAETVRDTQIVDLLAKVLTAGSDNNGRFEPSAMGVPQGGVLSPLLANVFLHQVDQRFHRARVHSADQVPEDRDADERVAYFRYADDIAVVVPGDAGGAAEILRQLETELRRLGLRLSQPKTSIAPASAGFEMLGFFLRRTPMGVDVGPSYKSVRSLETKLAELATQFPPTLDPSTSAINIRRVTDGWRRYFGPFEDLSDSPGSLERT